MREQQHGSALEKAVSGFAFTASAMATLFLIPVVVRLFRGHVVDYLSQDIGRQFAEWGSWGFVALAVACLFFCISIVLQFGIRLLFRSSAKRGAY